MLTGLKYFGAALNLLNLFCVFLCVYNSLTATTNVMVWFNIFAAGLNLWAFVRGYENIKDCIFPQKVKVNGK